jgi:hypothetical protein
MIDMEIDLIITSYTFMHGVMVTHIMYVYLELIFYLYTDNSRLKVSFISTFMGRARKLINSRNFHKNYNHLLTMVAYSLISF